MISPLPRFLLLPVVLSVLGWFGGAPVGPAAAESDDRIVGEATVLDGDTIMIGETTIQLTGLDAPELGQTCLNKKQRWRCGLEAAMTLRAFVQKDPVDCRVEGQGENHALGVCAVRGRDLAEVQLSKGYGVVPPNIRPRYEAAENGAHNSGLGIWRGEFILPWEWRKGQRLPQEDGQTVQYCEIKGIVDERGQRFFFMPTDPGYPEISVDPENGERLFCSDDEARLAGWRHGKRK